MKPELKLMLRGSLTCVVGMIFLAWGVSDLVIAFNAPSILIFIIPVIASLIFFIILASLYIRAKKAGSILDEKTVYSCSECGSTLKLEDKLCNYCGVENVNRKEALEKLEEMEKSIENEKAKLLEKMYTKKRKTYQTEEMMLELLNSNAREVRLRKVKLIIGNNLEDKIRWVKTQFHDMNRTIQDIADDLGESMITVSHYIDSEIELEEKIYNYLKENESKAFTIKAIMDRIFSDSPTEVSKELIEHSLENLVKHGKIQQTQKDAEIFYLY
ncbi:MAG: hypothetical protein ACFFAF_18310 [Candidatus Hermodarchaeota archaeon]